MQVTLCDPYLNALSVRYYNKGAINPLPLFDTAMRGLGRPRLAVPNVTAHPSPASVPITVLLYNGPLLCGFNVPIKC